VRTDIANNLRAIWMHQRCVRSPSPRVLDSFRVDFSDEWCTIKIKTETMQELVAGFLVQIFIGYLKSQLLCAAKDETSVEFMRPLLNSWAECSVVISC
jgi:hypothetical protein